MESEPLALLSTDSVLLYSIKLRTVSEYRDFPVYSDIVYNYCTVVTVRKLREQVLSSTFSSPCFWVKFCYNYGHREKECC
jgi:hypothetical protein